MRTIGHGPNTAVHFIGVGGAGMSALALVLAERGASVSGSDLKESRYTRSLRAVGVDVRIGHTADNVGTPDVVVVSTAVPPTNPELMAALDRGLEVWPRAKMLAHLAGSQDTVAVAGTHGKTSTSSMIVWMLREMGESPSFCVGGIVDSIDSNAASGTGRAYVVEADESDGSFVYLKPHVAVITNIEADHLDHYGSLEEIERVFAEFMDRTDEDGALVVCGDDSRLVELARESGRRVITYGGSEDCDYRFTLVGREGIGSRFTVERGDRMVCEATIATPGIHMVSNAAAAVVVSDVLGLDTCAAGQALSTYRGVRRRFDQIDEVAGVTIVDDYGHHPTEVNATLGAAADLGFERLVVVFQPHRYSRTEAFAAEFGASFDRADRVILMDVYSAGETPIPGVSGRTVIEAILDRNPHAQVAFLPHRESVVPYLRRTVREGDLVMTVGAGDVTALGPELAAALRG